MSAAAASQIPGLTASCMDSAIICLGAGPSLDVCNGSFSSGKGGSCTPSVNRVRVRPWEWASAAAVATAATHNGVDSTKAPLELPCADPSPKRMQYPLRRAEFPFLVTWQGCKDMRGWPTTLPGHDGSCSSSHAWVPANCQACIELLNGRESATCGHPLFAMPCLPCDAALGVLRWCRVNMILPH